jgi:quercetin dioxygenase-like cupin family protein
VTPPIRGETSPPWTSLGPGVRVRPLVEGAGTRLMLYRLEPGTQFEMHSHPYPELGMVLSGEGSYLLPGEQRATAAGDAYYFPGSMAHGFTVPGGGDPVILLDVSAAADGKDPPPIREMIAQMGRLVGAPEERPGRSVRPRGAAPVRRPPPLR